MMPYFIVFLVTPIAVAIALYRRNPRRYLDGPTEDAPLRLLRWAISLLSPQRAEWGQAMLGELAHLDGRWRRMRFAVGCTGAALILPPWGRAAAGLWAMTVIIAASFTIYTGMTVHYGLGVGAWIALAVVLLICVGYLLATSALLRRPGIALPGLLGGLFATLVGLAQSGFTPVDLVTYIPTGWHRGVTVLAVPAVIGAAGTLWRRDPAARAHPPPHWAPTRSKRRDPNAHTRPDKPVDPGNATPPSHPPHPADPRHGSLTALAASLQLRGREASSPRGRSRSTL